MVASSSPPSDSLEGKLRRLAPSAGSSRAFLLIVEGPRAGRLHLLGDQDMVIGRGEDVDIAISDSAVSHLHARVTRRPDGYYLLDEGSRNGTLLNGVLIAERRLRKRDRIQIGETTLVFLEEGAAESTLTVSVPRERAVQTIETDALRRRSDQISRAETVPTEENPVFDLIRKIVAVGRFIRRHIWLLIPIPLVGIGLGVLTIKLIPAPETAEAAVRLTQDQQKNPVDRQFNPFHNRDELPPFFAEPEKNFANPELVQTALTAMSVPATEEAVGTAFSGLSITKDNTGPTGVYTASFSQPSNPPPEFSSVGFLEQYLEAYLLHEVDKSIRVLKSEAGFVENQLRDVEAELADLEAELLKFRSENLDSLPEQAREVMVGKLDLAGRAAEIEVERDRIRMEVASIKKQLNSTDSVVATRVENLKPLQDDLSEKKREASDLRARGFKADHPDMRKLQTQITALEREIEQRLSSRVTDLERTIDPRRQELSLELQRREGDLRAAESALSKVREQLAGAAHRAAAVPEVEATIRRLTREQDSLQRLQAQLFEKHREKLVQIDLETANVRSRYEIVAPAALTNPLTKKFLIKRVGGGLAAGLFIALAIAGVMELRRLVRRHPELLKA